MSQPLPTRGYAAFDSRTPLRAFAFDRREPGPHDVLIEIQFCGVPGDGHDPACAFLSDVAAGGLPCPKLSS